MENILKNIGLSTNETIVYESLVKLGGSSSAGEIIKLSNLHRNIVYDALSHLEKSNLLQEVTKNKKKLFSLKDPKHLVTKYQQQIQNTEILAKIIESLPNSSDQEVTIYEGTTAWQEAWQNIIKTLEPGSTFYTLGMAGDPWVKLMGETFIAYEQWALNSKITDKIISQRYLQKEIEAHQNIQFREMRYIDIDLPANVSIEIFEDRCFFEIYENPASIIEIKSKGVREALLAYFNLLWITSSK